MENKEMTSEERIALIRDAYLASKSFKGNAFVEEFVAEEKTAEVLSRHGLIEVSLEDIHFGAWHLALGCVRRLRRA